ncbi:MAG: pentapeptide repeat-containing protein [Chloroflexota bacterium]
MANGFEAAEARSDNARKEGIKMITETPLFWGSIMLMIGLIAGFILFNGSQPRVNNEFMMSLLMEILSIIAAVGIIDVLNRRRVRKEKEQQFIRRAGSRDNTTAKVAVEEMQYENLLVGPNGVLSGKHHLQGANLNGADFRYANLSDTFLLETHLINADLTKTDLRHARLIGTELQEARLWWADLEGALIVADLRGTNLKNCNLKGSNIRENITISGYVDGNMVPREYYTKLDGETILPDGTKFNPEEGFVQLEKFTDPN